MFAKSWWAGQMWLWLSSGWLHTIEGLIVSHMWPIWPHVGVECVGITNTRPQNTVHTYTSLCAIQFPADTYPCDILFETTTSEFPLLKSTFREPDQGGVHWCRVTCTKDTRLQMLRAARMQKKKNEETFHVTLIMHRVKCGWEELRWGYVLVDKVKFGLWELKISVCCVSFLIFLEG